jgi:hypothetical protein
LHQALVTQHHVFEYRELARDLRAQIDQTPIGTHRPKHAHRYEEPKPPRIEHAILLTTKALAGLCI